MPLLTHSLTPKEKRWTFLGVMLSPFIDSMHIPFLDMVVANLFIFGLGR
jgi:hypothetical protein